MPNKLTIRLPWDYLPDNLLLSIFSYLSARTLLDITQTCKNWHRVAHDEFLWKDIFHSTWKFKKKTQLPPGKLCFQDSRINLCSLFRN